MCEQLYLTDDRLLFDKIRGGNAKAFEYAFRKFSPRLEAFAQKYTNDTNEAEDIVQDVFLKLWERRELLDNISLTSFLFMMVRNSCLNYLKHRQIADTVQQRIPDTETAERLYAADFVPDPSSLLIQKELSDSIDQIMEELPPKCKEAFVLSRLNGLKNREIAEHMAITEKVMENKRFEHIITRYLKGKATPEEEAELLQAIHASKEWEAAFRKRTAEWNPLEETEADPETDRKWNRIASIITPSESQSQTEEAPVISLVSTSSRRIWFSIAAVVLLLLVSGVTVYFLNQGGKAGTGNAEWQTIIAAQEDRSILLPDGSSVYLRENSELSYPEVFASSVREVKIKGEAFFEVTPNSEQPFIVDASGLSVKVLGTSFSVQTSDQGNEISVILVEGKVSLNNAHEKELVQLHPNQKADYFVNDEHYTVTEVDSERLTSWRKGIIFYDNASLDEIVRLIEQTYKVSLMYTRPENDDQRFSGAFLKTQKLETVLQQTNKLTGTNLILIQ